MPPRGGFPRQVLNFFKKIQTPLFSKYLFVTNATISTSLSATGDLIRQNVMVMRGDKSSWEKERTIHMGASGFTGGFVTHFWYQYLDRAFPGKQLPVVLKKVLLDTLISGPTGIFIFFITIGCLESRSWGYMAHEILHKGKHLLAVELLFWPPVQVINFVFVPPNYRIVYENTIALGYDTFASYVKYDLKDE